MNGRNPVIDAFVSLTAAAMSTAARMRKARMLHDKAALEGIAAEFQRIAEPVEVQKTLTDVGEDSVIDIRMTDSTLQERRIP